MISENKTVTKATRLTPTAFNAIEKDIEAYNLRATQEGKRQINFSDWASDAFDEKLISAKEGLRMAIKEYGNE